MYVTFINNYFWELSPSDNAYVIKQPLYIAHSFSHFVKRFIYLMFNKHKLINSS